MPPRTFQVKRRGLRLAIAWVFILPIAAVANPVVDPHQRFHTAVYFGLVALAMLIEVTVTALILILICQIEYRLRLVASLVVLNLATFYLFVECLYPHLHSVALVELMIWIAESLAMVQITRMLAEQPIRLKHAFMVAFVGNLFSFIVGLAG